MAGHTTTAPVNAFDRIQLPDGTPSISSSEAIIHLKKPPWLSANSAHHFLADYTLYSAWGNSLREALYNVPTLTITNRIPSAIKPGDLIKIRHDPGKGKRPHHFLFICKVPFPGGIDGIYSDL